VDNAALLANDMTELPRKATGTNPLVQTINQLRQCIIERTLLRDENFHADYQTNGFRLKPTKGGKGGTPAGTAARWA
jgi:hypothetical protein